MSRRALAASLAALLLSANALARPPAHGPNIVLIVVDTLRADHLTQLGYAPDLGPLANPAGLGGQAGTA